MQPLCTRPSLSPNSIFNSATRPHVLCSSMSLALTDNIRNYDAQHLVDCHSRLQANIRTVLAIAAAVIDELYLARICGASSLNDVAAAGHEPVSRKINLVLFGVCRRRPQSARRQDGG